MGLQIYELDSFKVTHASKYPAPVVSLGLSPNCSTLAVGMADGLLSIRKHARPKVITGPGEQPPKLLSLCCIPFQAMLCHEHACQSSQT